MDALPIDTSHPAVREYLALVRLQVLTPLSLLINIATVITCTILVTPSLPTISKLHPTALTPSASVVGAYVALIFLAQLGYCFLLVFVSKPETKAALTKGVGFALVCANILMALWSVAWVMQWFLLSTIVQGALLLVLLYSNIALIIYHPPVSERPMDTALIHAPMRFFLVLPLMLLFPLCLFITLHLSYTPTPAGPPRNYKEWHVWPAFGVLLGTNLFGLLVVAIHRDFVWCAAATWLCVSVLSQTPKPAPIFITSILFTALHPLTLLASMVYARFANRGRIALDGEQDSHPGLYAHRGESGESGTMGINAHTNPNADAYNNPNPNNVNGPREVEGWS